MHQWLVTKQPDPDDPEKTNYAWHMPLNVHERRYDAAVNSFSLELRAHVEATALNIPVTLHGNEEGDHNVHFGPLYVGLDSGARKLDCQAQVKEVKLLADSSDAVVHLPAASLDLHCFFGTTASNSACRHSSLFCLQELPMKRASPPCMPGLFAPAWNPSRACCH